MSRRALALGTVAVVALLSGCDDEELALTVDNLEQLGPEFRYAAWILEEDGDVDLAGTFNVNDEGNVVRFDEDDPDEQLETDVDFEDAEAFLISLERITELNLPDVDDPDFGEELEDELEEINDANEFDRIGPILIAGEFGVGGQAPLSVAHPLAFGTNFADVAGSYILVTPSTEDETDYEQGIWWMDSDFDEATLVLPELPAAWTYENWLVDEDGEVISLGSFDDPSELDSDGAGPLAGPDPVPNFPGQDFVETDMSVVGLRTFTTIEPVDDPNPAVPSGYIILEDDEITDVGRATLQAMANTAADELPTGTVRYIDDDI